MGKRAKIVTWTMLPLIRRNINSKSWGTGFREEARWSRCCARGSCLCYRYLRTDESSKGTSFLSASLWNINAKTAPFLFQPPVMGRGGIVPNGIMKTATNVIAVPLFVPMQRFAQYSGRIGKMKAPERPWNHTRNRKELKGLAYRMQVSPLDCWLGSCAIGARRRKSFDLEPIESQTEKKWATGISVLP